VSSDEVWHHDDGDPVELHTIDTQGVHSVAILGHDLERGERPQHLVPAGVWQAAVPRSERLAEPCDEVRHAALVTRLTRP
jgi:predicted cupin superfamily sugar epimerase